MKRILAALIFLIAAPAAAQDCVNITGKVAFCPHDTPWAGLPWHRVPDSTSTLWETQDIALLIGSVPVQFEGGPISVGSSELAGVIDDFSAMTEGAEEIGRFPPLGAEVSASSRVTRNAATGMIDYVTLYAIGGDILIVRTLAKAERLNQDHGMRHEQALKALVEVGT